jgi:hypothetical protein
MNVNTNINNNSNYIYKITNHKLLNPITKEINLNFNNVIEYDFNQADAITQQFAKIKTFNKDLVNYFKELISDITQIFINAVSHEEEFKKLPQNKNYKFYENLLKDFAHEWSIKGILNLENNFTIDLEGHKSSCMHAKLFKSVEHFLFNSPLLALTQTQKSQICYSLEQSIIYSFSEVPILHTFGWVAINALKDYQAGRPVTIAVKVDDHTVEITLHRHYFCYTNRGKRASVSRFCDDFNLKIFKIHKSHLLDLNFFKKIMSSPYIQLNWLEGNQPHEMKNLLGLERIFAMAKSSQKVGNCTWANAKGGFHALLILSYLTQALDQGMAEWEALNYADYYAQPIYKKWSKFSKKQTMDKFLNIIIHQTHLSSAERFKILSTVTTELIKKNKQINY